MRRTGVVCVNSALAERLTGGRYADIDIDRAAASRYGLNIADVQSVTASAVGGKTIGETVEGLARFPISVRYPRELRDSTENLRQLPILTDMGQQIALMECAARSASAPVRT
ncbi:MAG: heavy metal efflux pump CzcA [Gammaproteobacteria bacterium]|jgi:Cu(I)/Ag(I) efflux system membrane protein CusA/SilA|nr:heavy metal efflux pump CzcA [Gammaproteobacteria bacterium]